MSVITNRRGNETRGVKKEHVPYFEDNKVQNNHVVTVSNSKLDRQIFFPVRISARDV